MPAPLFQARRALQRQVRPAVDPDPEAAAATPTAAAAAPLQPIRCTRHVAEGPTAAECGDVEVPPARWRDAEALQMALEAREIAELVLNKIYT